ncbi:MAG: hypothetical protein ABSG53_14150 [Thermoguttaceae bacterium]|jgi:hypothetical protein
MKLCRTAAVLATWGLLIGPSAGCLSLSMLNREAPDTKARLDNLDSRVSALEAANSHPPYPPYVVPPPPSRP